MQDRGQLDAIIMLLFLSYHSISKFAKEFISMTTFMNCDLLTKFKRSKSLPFLLISMLVVPTYKDSHIFSVIILFIELWWCSDYVFFNGVLFFSVNVFFFSVVVYYKVGVFFSTVIFSCCLLFSDVVFNVVCCSGTHSTLMLVPSLMVFSSSMLKFVSRLVSSLIMVSSSMLLFSMLFSSMETIYFNVCAFFSVTLFFNASDFNVIIFLSVVVFNVLVFFSGDNGHIF